MNQTTPNLAPSAERLAALLDEIPDAALGAPTPCPEYTVGDLLDHCMGLAVGFALAARKQPVPGGPSGSAAELPPNWRRELPRRLDELAAAWSEPGAWEGETEIAGVRAPAAVLGLFALDEVVVHGWDLARAVGASYDADPADVTAILEGVEFSVGDGFGAPRTAPEGASDLERLVAATGRDPSWSAGA